MNSPFNPHLEALGPPHPASQAQPPVFLDCRGPKSTTEPYAYLEGRCNSHSKKILSLNRSLLPSPSLPCFLSAREWWGQPGHPSLLLLSSPPHQPSQAEAS